MFRHTGKNRTFIHNLKLASLLSFVAGIVNVSGFFAVQTLTTNVTGHFAYFSDQIVRRDTGSAVLYLLFILCFFAGAVVSGFLVEIAIKNGRNRSMYVIPVAVEIAILTIAGVLNDDTVAYHSVSIACSLLFAMGLQNALVTSISNAIVRTTHLTGLFTDLGIEVAQMFFYRKKDQHTRLKRSIGLRLSIILFFFSGCIIGGLTYMRFGIASLLLASATLIGGLVYDTIKFKVVLLKRKLLH